MAVDIRDRYRGCLLGHAVGDALGSPMEWLSVDVIHKANTNPCLDDYVDAERRIVEMTPGSIYADSVKEVFSGTATSKDYIKRARRPAGQTTDDTLFTMILAEVLATNGSLDMDSFSERLAKLGDLSDLGLTTKRAIKALNRYASIPGVWKVAGREVAKRSLHDKGWPQGSIESNGALMRIAPIGLYHVQSNSDAISRDAILSTIITHDSDICAWSSAFMAHVIANLARGKSKELSVKLAAGKSEQKGSVLTLFDEPYSARLWHRDRGSDQIFRTVSRSSATVGGNKLVACAAYDCLTGKYGLQRIAIDKVGSRMDFHYALHTLRIAIHYFLHTDSLEEALVRCVNHGGDTDTNAAVCGAMAGAYYGVDAIPKRWIDALNVGAPCEAPKLHYSVDDIETIAQNLFVAADARRPRQVIAVR